MLPLLLNTRDITPHEAQKYVDLVNSVLETHEGSTVEQFRIVFDMLGYSRVIRNVLNGWVDFAIVKRVQRLEIDLNYLYGSIVSQSQYEFPSWLLDIPLDFPSFDRLTSLCLRSVSIADADIAYFLSTCLLLEKLTLEHDFRLQNVRLSGQALKLSHLAIRYCASLKNLEISATNLTSFIYAGRTLCMRFGNVPKLSSVSLKSNYCELFIWTFHGGFHPSQLKKLDLDLKCLQHDRCADLPRTFPEFNNLQQLELRFIAAEDKSLHFLHFLSSILGASPGLHKLTLKYKKSALMVKNGPPIADGSLVELGGKLTHNCLKVIELAGWVGDETDVQFANYLIESAVSVEKIIFDLRIPHFFEVSWMGEFFPFQGDMEAALIAAKQLEGKLPSGAKLIIVQL